MSDEVAMTEEEQRIAALKAAIKGDFAADGRPIRDGLAETLAELVDDPETEWFPSLRNDDPELGKK